MVGRWSMDERDGELLVLTDREGPAARLGHRLTIVMTRWRGEVTQRDGVPVSASLRVEVASLQVRSGEGGVKSLSGPEREVARRQALRTLGSSRHPLIEFAGDEVAVLPDGYELSGHLSIQGTTRPHQVVVHEDQHAGGVRLTAETSVRQSDHGLRPVSFMLGALTVADRVSVRFAATRS